MHNGSKERPHRRGVLVISQYYDPEPNFISSDLAKELARTHRVTVVTSHPNYPNGSFYPGTRWWLPRRSTENGVVVWRLPIFPDHSNSLVRRLLSYLSFAFGAAIVAPLVAGRPRTVWVYHTPFTSALAALWFKYLYGVLLVYTCVDLWPESLAATGVNERTTLTKVLLAYRRFINRRADVLVCSTRGMVKQFSSEGIPTPRLPYVPVWVEGVVETDTDTVTHQSPRLVYAGNIGPAQHLSTIVLAAALLKKRGVKVDFDFYGSGTSEEELKSLAVDVNADNVHFHGRVPPSTSFDHSKRAFGQIVCLRRTRLFEMTIPSKLLAAFAAGAPILYGLVGEAGDLTQQSGGGISFDSDDPESFADAVEALLNKSPAERAEMQCRLRRFYEENFKRETLLRRYRAILVEEEFAAGVGTDELTAA